MTPTTRGRIYALGARRAARRATRRTARREAELALKAWASADKDLAELKTIADLRK